MAIGINAICLTSEVSSSWSKYDDDLVESFAKIVLGTIESHFDKVKPRMTHKIVPNIPSTCNAIVFTFYTHTHREQSITLTELEEKLFTWLDLDSNEYIVIFHEDEQKKKCFGSKI